MLQKNISKSTVKTVILLANKKQGQVVHGQGQGQLLALQKAPKPMNALPLFQIFNSEHNEDWNFSVNSNEK